MSLPTMNVERLRKLQAELRAFRKTKKLEFNMDHWFQGKLSEPTGEFTSFGYKLPENICSTAACALGLAAMMPEFEKAGLKLRVYGRDRFLAGGVEYDHEGCSYQDDEAGAWFFGLTKDEAEALFLPGSYGRSSNPRITPKQVAKRIDAIIAGKYRK